MEPFSANVSVELQWQVRIFPISDIPVGWEPFHYLATKTEQKHVSYEWVVCKRAEKKVIETTEKYGRKLTAVYDEADPRAAEALGRGPQT